MFSPLVVSFSRLVWLKKNRRHWFKKCFVPFTRETHLFFQKDSYRLDLFSGLEASPCLGHCEEETGTPLRALKGNSSFGSGKPVPVFRFPFLGAGADQHETAKQENAADQRGTR